MAYVTIPKDLTKVKSKVMFGLTKRQLICFGAAALIGVPLFFLLKSVINTTAATLCMILVMLPFFLLALYERHGQPLEVIAGHIIRFAFPLLIGNIFQQLYNTVDTWVVGNFVSNAAFSAVGTVTPIINMLIGFL